MVTIVTRVTTNQMKWDVFYQKCFINSVCKAVPSTLQFFKPSPNITHGTKDILLRIPTLFWIGGWTLLLRSYGVVKTVDDLADAQLNLTKVTKHSVPRPCIN